MDKILLFAGTTEGRRLAEYLSKYGQEAHVCVATEYGEKLIVSGKGLHVHTGRMSGEEMARLIRREEITLTVDATHPYAIEASENIQLACEAAGALYIRLLRSPSEDCGDCVRVDSVHDAVTYLSTTKGNILVTTGSKELSCFTSLPDYQERVYARVLSTPEVAVHCAEMGFVGKHLICMQGPFDEDMNAAMLKHTKASWLVTKDSGNQGGFQEKLRAARVAGAKTILIDRPKETVQGMDEMEVRAILCKRLHIPVRPVISIVGIGMGNPENMTVEAQKACEEAELVIGAGRMLQAVSLSDKDYLNCYKAEEIKAYVDAHPEYEKVAILMSGDVGFYSGGKKLFDACEDKEVHIYSGISSVVYLCGKLGVSWEDVKLISLHGREQNVVSAVARHRKTFVLVGKKGDVNRLCEKLVCYGMGHVQVAVGEDLSYEQERITKGRADELMEGEFQSLCVVLIQNEEVKKSQVHGIPDEDFIREKVPMTKAEVRSISLSKLLLEQDSVVYDVGAGTGSVSIEMALQAVDGQVYAVEKKPEAVELIGRNQIKFAADNLAIIKGEAPEALLELPVPTHAFIGGSSGNLKAILKTIFKKNPSARIVINAIALETVAESLACIRQFDVVDVDIVTVAVGKSKEVGNYHMMMGQNPVYIISFTGGGA